MNRFVALAWLLAACAQASDAQLGGDAGDVDAVALVDAAPPDACVPAAETCNNADDDCDGTKDNGLGVGTPCDGDDSDLCTEGMIVCDGNGGTRCNDASGDTVEVCNGLDDDCQNGIDDTFPVGQACSVGLGSCARTGQLVCNTAQNGTVCNAVAGAPMAEFCGNNIDEDCNGVDATCPANDAAAGAIDITAGGTFTVDLTVANDDNWTASTPQLDCGEQGGRDAFYQFTLNTPEVVYFDSFGTGFDTVIRVFSGACTAIGPAVACADDACSTTRSQGAVNLAAGTYCLVLDQFSANTAGGMATLTFRRGGRTGVAIARGNGTYTGTTAGQGNQSAPNPMCESNSTQPDVGHFFTSCPGTTTVSASTCTGTAFDSVLYLRTGAATTDVACNDDSCSVQSRITNASVTGPNLHWLIVDGFGTAGSGSGSYTLTYSVQ